MVRAFLYRLLVRKPLSASIKLGPEDKESVLLADRLRLWSMEGRFRGVWWHTPNEVGYDTDRRARIRYARAIAMGCVPGTPDFVFIGCRSLVVEMKSKLGRLSDRQEDFRDWCELSGVSYHVCTSADEVEVILRKEGLLL